MANKEKKEKEFFADFAIGEKFNHNHFTYTKISPVYSETFSPLGQTLTTVKRYFDAYTKVQSPQG